ncbi:integrase/recombinase XerD [Alphaproteobacteria bacterium]
MASNIIKIMLEMQGSGCIDTEVKEGVVDWLHYLFTQKHYSLHTITAYRTDLLYFLRFTNTHFQTRISFDLIKSLTIQDFRAWLSFRKQSGVMAVSNARSLSVLRNFFRYLQRHHDVVNQSILAIKVGRLNRALPKALSQDDAIDATRMINTVSEEDWVGLRDTAILLLLYGCGLRIGEVLAIKKQSFSNNCVVDSVGVNQYITVNGKGNKERVLPILPVVYETISAYVQRCPYDLDKNYLFVGIRGKRLNPDVFRAKIRLLKNTLGLPSYTSPHIFRHSFATHLLGEGADLRTIQEALGHDSLAATQLYTKVESATLLKVYQQCHPRSKMHIKQDQEAEVTIDKIAQAKLKK